MVGSSHCGECSRTIRGLEDRIECYGCCGNIFHLSCVQLNEYDRRRCGESDNLLWLCDCCLASFRKRFAASKPAPVREDSAAELNNSNDNMRSTLDRLQSQITEMKSDFSELKRICNSDLASQKHNSDFPCSSTPICHLSNVNSSSINEQSINRSTKLFTGSKVVARSSKNIGRFWMYFTRVARHVTENDVTKMVTDSLELANPPIVVKVTPRWINEDDVRYNSFKVGLRPVYREVALRESTWPSGLMFREFENSSHNIALWEP